MSNGSNMDFDIIAEKNSPKLGINFQESFSSSNKSNNDFETTKSGNNAITNSKIPTTKDLLQNHDIEINTLFNSEISETKHKISSNSLNQKFSNNKLNILTTDPNIHSDNNLQSPKKKKYTMLKMVQKSKYKKFFETPLAYTKKIDEESVTGRERRDAFGNLINRRNKKKVKVSFADELEEVKPLVSVIDIESYKKFNYIFGMPNEDFINKNVRANCQCCLIF